MLTIRHVELDGRESLFTAVSIERTPEGQLAFGQGARVVRSGKVYVMNDAGKTVAVYDFEKEKP